MRRTARFCLTLGMLCLLALSAACGGGGSKHSPATAQSTPQALVTVASTRKVTPNPKATPPSDLVLLQKAFITARGFYPDDPIMANAVVGQLYAFRSTCAVSVTVNHDNCQVVHFFLDGTYLGTDTAYTFYGYETVTAGRGHVTVSYTTYGPEDPECCPTIKQNVVYQWTEDALVASGEPPRPRGEPFDKNGQLANKIAPLYVAAYPEACVPTSLTIPSNRQISITFVNASGASHTLRIVGHVETAPVAAGSRAVLDTAFALRDAPYEFDCGSGRGEIRVVPPLLEN